MRKWNLQLFAADTVMNTTGGVVTSGTAAATNALAPELKDYYNTKLLENYKTKRIFAQFGMHQKLPKQGGNAVEFRKFNTLSNGSKLTEGVTPNGQALGVSKIRATLNQYGTYFTVSDRLELHAIDDVILQGTKELANSMNRTMETLVRDGLLTGTNVMYCDNVFEDGSYIGTPTACSGMEAGGVKHVASASVGASTGITAAAVTAATFGAKVGTVSGVYTFSYESSAWKLNGNTVTLADYGITVTGTAAANDVVVVNYRGGKAIAALTPAMVANAATLLVKGNAPKIQGCYVAVIHPSVAHDLMINPAWIDLHKYDASTEIFNGEIGKLYDVRFILANHAPVLGVAGATASDDDSYVNADRGRTYATYFFGEDSFGIVDPEGGGAEIIAHGKDEIGGPLNQYSTVGYKFETNGATILYPERCLRVMSCSSYSAVDAVN